MKRIGLFGASGRMGRAIAQLLSEHSTYQLSEAIAHPTSSALGEFLYGIPIRAEFHGDADLVIDVSLPKGNLVSLVQKPLVIGITGLSEAQMNTLSTAALHTPIFYSPNFSLGMALFTRLAREAATHFDPKSSVDLFEAHHAHKKDTPSGSALNIQKQLMNKPVRIHSIRSGAIIGEHRLLLNSEEERIEISHTVHHRIAFAKGALAAADFLLTKGPGLYGMDDLL
jgi:4-hydroxy-tetrahydrodipicolinate reductase